MKKRFYIIDGNSYIHRAFHALPFLNAPDGTPVNACYGFTRMLLKIVNKEKPDYLAVCFDSPWPTFRHKKFAPYKANREKAPDELKVQIPLTHQIVKAFEIQTFTKQGYEADDLIATVIEQLKQKDIEIVIVTGDKDALQLIDKNINVLNEPKNMVYTKDNLKETMGLTPEQLVDYYSLIGDSSDNIPGVKGVGPKTANELILRFGSLDNIFNNLDKIKESLRKKLQQHKEDAYLSKDLILLQKNAPITVDMDACRLRPFHSKKIIDIFIKLGFKTLLKDIEFKEEKIDYKIVSNSGQLESLIDKIEKTNLFSFFIIEDGLSISTERENFFTPFKKDLFNGFIEKQTALKELRHIFENERIKKIGYDLKSSINLLKDNSIDLKGIHFDCKLAYYLLESTKNSFDIENLSLDYLGKPLNLHEEIMNQNNIARYHCSRTQVVLKVFFKLVKSLEEKRLDNLFFNIEMPLIYVLADMEINGIRVDKDYLYKFSEELKEKIKKLKEDIYKKAGEKFNINSPKQLSSVLFEKLKLPSLKKTKKSSRSTAEDVLKILSGIHPLPRLILEYRQLEKLNSTYTLNLIELINPKTGRIHTSFDQTGTVTGRLSSFNPNLQNIPIRTELGRKIRHAFIPEQGNLFLSADYSQIDLRVLAHISEDKNLINAFENNEDIHDKTAKELFLTEYITPEMRRVAKVVNFGISYGMSSYGLSQDLGIPVEEAKQYIKKYFSKYPGVKRYIENTIELAKKQGYVTTILERRRYIPDINSSNLNLRGSAERTAINMPIQGTSADIIKVAMLRIFKKIKEEKRNVKILLQIHDELLFEIPEEKLKEEAKWIKKEMENAIKLIVPVVVDLKYGKNWDELERVL